MVIKSQNKHAFTLIEAVVSLIVLVAVGGLIIPFLNRGHNTQVQNMPTNKGIFACFYDKNTNRLKQTLYENDTLKEEKDVNDAQYCTFDQGKRASRFYIVAAGAGSKVGSGQVVTLSTDQVGGKIKPGVYKTESLEPGVTPFSVGKTVIDAIEVLPGVEFENGLQFENMIAESSCKLLKAPQSCPEKCKVYADKIAKPIGCVLAKNEDNIPVIKIVGCACDDDSDFDTNSIPLSKVQRDNDFLDRLDIKNINSLRLTQDKNIYKYKFNNDEFKFNFILKDSNYDSRLKPDEFNGYSNMNKILSNIYVTRQNDLVRKLISLNPGAPKKNGAVIIMW